MIIAITGSVGSGKTTLAGIFRKFGCSVISADRLGYEVLKENSVKTKLRKAFGTKIFDKKNNIIRKKLADVAFQNKQNLNKLNKITHSRLIKRIKEKIKNINKKNKSKKDEKPIAIDVALYNELKISKIADKTVLVKAKKAIVEKRLKRSKSKELIKRKAFQKPIRGADFIIYNNSFKKELEKTAKERWRQIRNENSNLSRKL